MAKQADNTPAPEVTPPATVPTPEVITPGLIFEVSRVEVNPEGGDYLFGRAVDTRNASNVQENEAIMGEKPRGFFEIVLTGGPQLGQIRAGMRVALRLEVLDPGHAGITL